MLRIIRHRCPSDVLSDADRRLKLDFAALPLTCLLQKIFYKRGPRKESESKKVKYLLHEFRTYD